jgi:hypothetical protein
MSVDKRTPQVLNYSKLPNPGPFLARIVNNADPMKQGSLEVELLRPVGNQTDASQQLFTVRYLSPFYGVTSIDHTGANTSDFNDTQKSYGFWAVPPDIGVTVMVIFVEADPGQGFWFGCVQDTYMNHMIPGIAGSTATEANSRHSTDTAWEKTSETKTLFGDTYLPVGEINRKQFKLKDNAPNPNPDVDSNKKPVHPIAEWLREQGTIHDPVRGVYTSSARRESPSNVYGWSTPGPRDKRQGAKRGKIGRRESKIDTFVSRMGGHCIVMDDGDERFLRKTRPWEGPPDYADVEAGETGLVDWPRDEAFRIRTRKGAQILLHNSEDLIFITNSRGTAWMEFTSRGAINFHAQEGVHMGTDGDLSFSAGRDVIHSAARDTVSYAAATHSVEAGNRVSLNSQFDIHMDAKSGSLAGNAAQLVAFKGDTGLDMQAQNVSINGSSYEWNIGGNFMLTCTGNFEVRSANTLITSDNETHLVSGAGLLMLQRTLDCYSGSEMLFKADGGMALQAGDAMILQSGSLMSIASGSSVALSATGSMNIRSGAGTNVNAVGGIGLGAGEQIILKGSQVHLNGPDAPLAAGPVPAPNVREAVEAHFAAKSTAGTPQAGGSDVGTIQNIMWSPSSANVPPGAANYVPSKQPFLNENTNPLGINWDTKDIKKSTGPCALGDTKLQHVTVDSYQDIPNTRGGTSGGHIGWASLRSGRGALHDYGTGSVDSVPTTEYGTKIVIGDWKNDSEFMSKVQQCAGILGITRNEMLAIIKLESSFNPHVKNASGHTGLIQMGNAEAQSIGTSTGALRQMSRGQQMDWVIKYFKSRMKGGPPGEVGGAYMLVALPAYANAPLTQPIATCEKGSKHYSWWFQNPAWRDKQIPGNPVTRRGIGDAVRKVAKAIDSALGNSNNTGPQNQTPPTNTSPGGGSYGTGTNPGTRA